MAESELLFSVVQVASVATAAHVYKWELGQHKIYRLLKQHKIYRLLKQHKIYRLLKQHKIYRLRHRNFSLENLARNRPLRKS